MNWFQRNFKTIVYFAFVIPILTVAFVSISHVTKWYGLSNPVSWAMYLSVGVEIAALSSLAAIAAQMGKRIYFPFGVVTLLQFIGNVYFAYQYIDINSIAFKDWVDLVDPIVSFLGVESGNVLSHKRFLALFSGGMLPLISLSFLHMLVKFEEKDKTQKDVSESISEPELIVESKTVVDNIETDEQVNQVEIVEEPITQDEQQFDEEQSPQIKRLTYKANNG
jgi:hypothetical protein